jgi:hypothetical protein
MQRYILHFALSLGLLLGVGCTQSFVDIKPYAQVPIDNFYQTEADFRQAVSGVYNTLRGRYTNYWQFAEVPSDNATFGPGGQVATSDFDFLTWLPSNGALTDQWIGHYQTIANANIILGRIGPVQMDAALKARLVAETKFIRALMYFNLVRYFGDVPLVTTELADPAASYTYLRRPVAEVYEQIVTDLREAVPALPATYPAQADRGRVTSGAARALLGKVFLQQRRFQDARTALQEVVNGEAAAGYALLANYRNIFLQDNNAEMVFSVQYENDNNGSGSPFPHWFIPSATGASVYGPPIQNQDLNLGTEDLYNAFDPADPRRAVAIERFPAGVAPVYFTRKFVDPGLNQNFNSDVDWPVIRYADVLLMYAEALNETGATAEALAQTNRVRARVGLAALTGLSQGQAREAILLERRLELCFEGHRWYDLVRAGTAVATMQRFRATYNVTNMAVDANKLLYPIPQREININGQLSQNPGY